MSKGPWIRFFPSDWLAGTRGMTATETGVYITLIAMMYERGEPIQRDHARLARLCGTTPASMKDTLTVLIDEGKLVVRDGGLWNDRVEVETKIRSEKITQAGKSAKTRWEKGKKNQCENDADALRSHCDGNANQNQNQNQKDKIDIGIADSGNPPAREPQTDDCPTLPLAIVKPGREVALTSTKRPPLTPGLETFPQWYAQFPRKVSRGNAEKAYAKIIKSGEATPAELLAGAMRYAAAVAGTEPRYIKHPASWLNAKGWLDEPEPQSWRSDPPSRADSAIQGIQNFLIRNGELS